ncbi:hypothetical protein [Parapedobacter koreensis]|uniref:Uncharacterized protein n=1 Tax=Parapedobacter koreensis TaxID=332977 RepID=A0A1H7P7S3_9SPHI|nr:hypothetical protein [Parapedobacter koreensis]SEL31137.1 hypothetical protein SAMN05421740_104224 [Parapedobacter koreensis]
MTTKQKKVVPFAAMLFALVAMSFQVVALQQPQWYLLGPVLSNGDQAIAGQIGAPSEGGCLTTPQPVRCAVQHEDGDVYDFLSEIPPASIDANAWRTSD